jgi:two-component system cell cycle response regulator DivK
MNQKRSRIAIVEDNADNRMLLEELLSDRYDIDGYEDGISSLVGMRANPPRVVLLDISLPSMTGSEVLARMREDPVLEPIPVIALTAHGMPDDRARFLAEGFDAYISKPIIDDAVLYDEIERLLEQDPR